jgi:uncharacterized protein YndB with AHSA1/START domain
MKLAAIITLVILPALLAPVGRCRAQQPAPDTSPVISEVDLNVPVSKVWDAFTTDEGFKLLGVAKAKVDLRVGGKILSHYSPQGELGDEGTIENTILAYEPNHVFAFRISKAPKGFPYMKAYKDVWSVATMTDLGQGRTHLRLAMCGYTKDEESQRMRAFFSQGNQWVLDKLKKNLEGDAVPAATTPPAAAPAISPAAPTPAASTDPLAPIIVEALIPAMQEDVWKCWTTSEGVTSFLTEEASVELRIGGPYEFYFKKDAPKGQRGSEGCKVLSFEPMSMVSFSWNAPPKFPYAREQRTWVLVRIDPHGPHSTKVTLKHMGFADEAGKSPEHAQEWKEVRAYFANAWPSVLKALQEKFAPPK